MCVHVCANVCGIQNLSPPCPVVTSWEQSSCSPGRSQHLDNDRSSPHSQLSGAPPPQPLPGVRRPPWQRRTRLPFLQGPEGKQRLVLGWGEHSGLAAQQDHLPSVGCLPLPAPSSFRLRVHHSGDPWELEANFPRSLAMERPQVLPLIKVKREVEETRCTQASSSHL